MAIGVFDPELFARMRKAKGETLRLLLGRLLIENEPLTKKLVAQLLGRSRREARRAGERPERVARCPGTEADGRIPGADLLDWEDALQNGRIGMAKAFESLDLEKGKLSYHALRKIHYELQGLIAKHAAAKVERGQEATVSSVYASSYADEDGGSDLFEAMTHEHREMERGPVHDQEDIALARVEVDANARYREIVQADPVGTFVEGRLQFGERFRELRTRMSSAFEEHVRFYRVIWWSIDDLRAALQQRGASRAVMRFNGIGPAGAWRGVRLQIEQC